MYLAGGTFLSADDRACRDNAECGRLGRLLTLIWGQYQDSHPILPNWIGRLSLCTFQELDSWNPSGFGFDLVGFADGAADDPENVFAADDQAGLVALFSRESCFGHQFLDLLFSMKTKRRDAVAGAARAQDQIASDHGKVLYERDR